MAKSLFIQSDDVSEYFTRGYEFAEKDFKSIGSYINDNDVISGALRLAYLLWPDDKDTFKPHIRMFVQIFRDGYRAHKNLKFSNKILFEDLMKLSIDTAKAFDSVARELEEPKD